MNETKRGNFWQGVHIVMSRVVFKPRKRVSPFKTVRNRQKWHIKALAAAAEKKVTQKSCWYTLVLPPRAYLSRCPNDAQDFFDDAQHDAHIFDDAQEYVKG